jgi:hypothetical protein
VACSLAFLNSLTCACSKTYLMLPPPRTSARMQLQPTEQPPPRASRRALNQRHQKHSCMRTHLTSPTPYHPTTSHTPRNAQLRHKPFSLSHTHTRTHTHTHTHHTQRSDKSIMRITKQTNKQKHEQTDDRTRTTAKRDPQTTRCSPSSAGSAIVPQHLPFLAW